MFRLDALPHTGQTLAPCAQASYILSSARAHVQRGQTPTSVATPRSTRIDSPRFLAIDFETADSGRDSACSVALVGVRDGGVVFKRHYLIRPPRRIFRFTGIHGIDWPMVANAPTFAELWPALQPAFAGAHFLVAHNAAFDRGVLNACCEAAGVAPPPQPFVCTVRLARRAWQLRPARLPDVCAHLGVELKHHDALSDAHACAQILIHAGLTHLRDAMLSAPR